MSTQSTEGEGEREMEGENAYLECMRNYSATLGAYTMDGCGEFLAHPGGMQCAACDCHRNFHRKERNLTGTAVENNQPAVEGRRRTRTRFTVEQREAMRGFAERMTWKMPKRDEDDQEVARFCGEAGVKREALKVWMHNHKGSARGGRSSSEPVSPLAVANGCENAAADADSVME